MFRVRPEHRIYSTFSHATLKNVPRYGVNVYHCSGYLFLLTFAKINKNTNTIKMEEDTDLFCWQIPQLKKYIQERGIWGRRVVLLRVYMNKHET